MSRLLRLAVLAVTVVAAGLALQRFREHWWADVAGSVLYAVLVHVLVTAVAPRLRPPVVAAVAFACCATVEVLQLTGLPSAAADAFPPSALVLGSGFAWSDLLAYAVGCAGAGAVHTLARRSAGRDGGGRLPAPR